MIALDLPDTVTVFSHYSANKCKRVREDFGWLMSVPNRHQVVWHISATVIPAVNGMARFAAMGYSDSPTPVSPHVFWWNGTSYEQLTEVSGDGGLAIRVSPAFQAVLESMTADR
jgi:hypothetical protein